MKLWNLYKQRIRISMPNKWSNLLNNQMKFGKKFLIYNNRKGNILLSFYRKVLNIAWFRSGHLIFIKEVILKFAIFEHFGKISVYLAQKSYSGPINPLNFLRATYGLLCNHIKCPIIRRHLVLIPLRARAWNIETTTVTFSQWACQSVLSKTIDSGMKEVLLDRPLFIKTNIKILLNAKEQLYWNYAQKIF